MWVNCRGLSPREAVEPELWREALGRWLCWSDAADWEGDAKPGCHKDMHALLYRGPSGDSASPLV